MKPYGLRGYWPVLRLGALPVLVVCIVAAGLLTAAGAARAADPAAAASKGEFGGQCVQALAEGQHVKTNCTSTWTDKDGKIYCFNNEGPRRHFCKTPAENLQRARSFIAASNVEAPKKPCRTSRGPTPRRWSRS